MYELHIVWAVGHDPRDDMVPAQYALLKYFTRHAAEHAIRRLNNHHRINSGVKADPRAVLTVQHSSRRQSSGSSRDLAMWSGTCFKVARHFLGFESVASAVKSWRLVEDDAQDLDEAQDPPVLGGGGGKRQQRQQQPGDNLAAAAAAVVAVPAETWHCEVELIFGGVAQVLGISQVSSDHPEVVQKLGALATTQTSAAALERRIFVRKHVYELALRNAFQQVELGILPSGKVALAFVVDPHLHAGIPESFIESDAWNGEEQEGDAEPEGGAGAMVIAAAEGAGHDGHGAGVGARAGAGGAAMDATTTLNEPEPEPEPELDALYEAVPVQYTNEYFTGSVGDAAAAADEADYDREAELACAGLDLGVDH